MSSKNFHAEEFGGFIGTEEVHQEEKPVNLLKSQIFDFFRKSPKQKTKFLKNQIKLFKKNTKQTDLRNALKVWPIFLPLLFFDATTEIRSLAHSFALLLFFSKHSNTISTDSTKSKPNKSNPAILKKLLLFVFVSHWDLESSVRSQSETFLRRVFNILGEKDKRMESKFMATFENESHFLAMIEAKSLIRLKLKALKFAEKILADNVDWENTYPFSLLYGQLDEPSPVSKSKKTKEKSAHNGKLIEQVLVARGMVLRSACKLIDFEAKTKILEKSADLYIKSIIINGNKFFSFTNIRKSEIQKDPFKIYDSSIKLLNKIVETKEFSLLIKTHSKTFFSMASSLIEILTKFPPTTQIRIFKFSIHFLHHNTQTGTPLEKTQTETSRVNFLRSVTNSLTKNSLDEVFSVLTLIAPLIKEILRSKIKELGIWVILLEKSKSAEIKEIWEEELHNLSLELGFFNTILCAFSTKKDSKLEVTMFSLPERKIVFIRTFGEILSLISGFHEKVLKNILVAESLKTNDNTLKLKTIKTKIDGVSSLVDSFFAKTLNWELSKEEIKCLVEKRLNFPLKNFLLKYLENKVNNKRLFLGETLAMVEENGFRKNQKNSEGNSVCLYKNLAAVLLALKEGENKETLEVRDKKDSLVSNVSLIRHCATALFCEGIFLVVLELAAERTKNSTKGKSGFGPFLGGFGLNTVAESALLLGRGFSITRGDLEGHLKGENVAKTLKSELGYLKNHPEEFSHNERSKTVLELFKMILMADEKSHILENWIDKTNNFDGWKEILESTIGRDFIMEKFSEVSKSVPECTKGKNAMSVKCLKEKMLDKISALLSKGLNKLNWFEVENFVEFLKFVLPFFTTSLLHLFVPIIHFKSENTDETGIFVSLSLLCENSALKMAPTGFLGEKGYEHIYELKFCEEEKISSLASELWRFVVSEGNNVFLKIQQKQIEIFRHEIFNKKKANFEEFVHFVISLELPQDSMKEIKPSNNMPLEFFENCVNLLKSTSNSREILNPKEPNEIYFKNILKFISQQFSNQKFAKLLYPLSIKTKTTLADQIVSAMNFFSLKMLNNDPFGTKGHFHYEKKFRYAKEVFNNFLESEKRDFINGDKDFTTKFFEARIREIFFFIFDSNDYNNSNNSDLEYPFTLHTINTFIELNKTIGIYDIKGRYNLELIQSLLIQLENIQNDKFEKHEEIMAKIFCLTKSIVEINNLWIRNNNFEKTQKGDMKNEETISKIKPFLKRLNMWIKNQTEFFIELFLTKGVKSTENSNFWNLEGLSKGMEVLADTVRFCIGLNKQMEGALFLNFDFGFGFALKRFGVLCSLVLGKDLALFSVGSIWRMRCCMAVLRIRMEFSTEIALEPKFGETNGHSSGRNQSEFLDWVEAALTSFDFGENDGFGRNGNKRFKTPFSVPDYTFFENCIYCFILLNHVNGGFIRNSESKLNEKMFLLRFSKEFIPLSIFTNQTVMKKLLFLHKNNKFFTNADGKTEFHKNCKSHLLLNPPRKNEKIDVFRKVEEQFSLIRKGIFGNKRPEFIISCCELMETICSIKANELNVLYKKPKNIDLGGLKKNKLGEKGVEKRREIKFEDLFPLEIRNGISVLTIGKECFKREYQEITINKKNHFDEILFTFLSWNIVTNVVEKLKGPLKLFLLKHIKKNFKNEFHGVMAIISKYTFEENTEIEKFIIPNNIFNNDNNNKNDELNLKYDELFSDLANIKGTLRLFSPGLYLRFLSVFPSVVREWMESIRRSQAISVRKLTEKYFSPVCIKREIETALKTKKIKTKRGAAKDRKLKAFYEKESLTLCLEVTFPSCYPLERLSISLNKNLNLTKKDEIWTLRLANKMNDVAGTIEDAILLWRENVEKHLQGVTDCPICFTIVNESFGGVPRIQCRTCNTKFHEECISKWLATSENQSCPMCRSRFFD